MARKHRKLDPGSHLDRFRLDRLLGTGAFGQVWLAIDEGGHGFRKQVALKILADTKDSRRTETLMREARICGALNHPSIIDVHGVMQVEDASFIIMEYVEGETLSELWKDLDFLNVRFPRSIILDIGISVCEALYHAWTAVDAQAVPLRIVHRDLKPANVMISDRGVVKVGDFGIAKVAPDVTVTRTGKLKGTPSYLAPEIWHGSRDFRPAIDLWSLGIILWEMSVGKRFYGRAGMGEIFDLVSKRSPSSEVREMIGYFPELSDLVETLLQRDPDERAQDALQVGEQLRSIRHRVGSSGDLLQFSRLVRAGRLEPADRKGSLAALPALPIEALDWKPLIAVAAGDSPPGAIPAVEKPPSASQLVRLGPDSKEGPVRPSDATQTDAEDLPPRPAQAEPAAAKKNQGETTTRMPSAPEPAAPESSPVGSASAGSKPQDPEGPFATTRRIPQSKRRKKRAQASLKRKSEAAESIRAPLPWGPILVIAATALAAVALLIKVLL